MGAIKRSAVRCSCIAALLFAMNACQPVIGEETGDGSTAQADGDASADERGGGSSAYGPQSSETGATDDPWELCDSAALGDPPPGAGPCAGAVPAGELDVMQAEWIFGRATHEIDHVAEFVHGNPDGSALFESDGDHFQALADLGYVVGHIAREDATRRACVTLSYACWTGGHGGFGASALDGRADVLVDGDVVEARGALGLTEGGALTGAPAAEVWVRMGKADVEGSVGAFEF